MHISEPTGTHVCTIIALHGFTSNAQQFRDKLEAVFPGAIKQNARVLFPNAPLRAISCYDGRKHRSWHDYFSNYGDSGENKEESIDVAQLDETSTEIGSMVCTERKRSKHVWLLGESQGACVALDAAIRARAPVIMLYGQRYTSTSTQSDATIVYSFHGGHDTVIPSTIGIKSLNGMSGRVHTTIAQGYEHAEVGEAVAKFLQRTVRGLLGGC